MKNLLLLGLALVLVLAGAAFAYPTLTGPTGLATLPTAATLPAGQLALAADYYDTSDGIIENTFPLRVTFGLAESWEIGAAYLSQTDANLWAVNTKFGPLLNLLGFDWSAGAQYAQQDFPVNDETVMQAYWVGDMVMSEGGEGQPTLGLTVGVNWTDSDLLDTDAFRAFVGIQAGFASDFSVGAEYQTKDDDIEAEALWSVFARLGLTDSLAVQAGWTNGPFFGTNDHNLFVGVNFGWGMIAE
jgi:hypothetical protein